MAEQPSDGAPLWPGTGDLAGRLDRIERRLADLDGLRGAVQSALVAQATRIETVLATARRELGDRVAAETAGAREAADEVRAALAAARDLTADRLDAAADASSEVAEVVRGAVARVEAELDDRLDEATAGARAATGPVEALAGAVEALHDLVVDARSEAREDRARVEGLVEEVRGLAATVRTTLGEVTDALARQADTSVVAVRGAATDAARELRSRLDEAAGPLRDAAATVQALDTSLRQHVDEMEWRGAVERARLTQAFVEQLADGLGRRERRRLARRIEVPDPPDARAGGGRDEPLGAGSEVARPVGASGPSPVSVGDPASDPGPEAARAVDDVPTWERPVRDVPPDRVTPSRRTRPVRRTASDPQDPAAVRRALTAVRGLGPARQSALIDRFGTLEAIRDASDDELLALPGIGPALIPGIRDVVG